jgi:hypothetical protein
MLVTRVTDEGLQIRPVLGNGIRTTYMPFSKWWTEIIYIQDAIEISRKSLVLSAANQDGGAHVDHELDDSYKFLSEDGSYLTAYIEKSGSTSIHKSEDVHLALLRQISFELLNSPQLLGLSKT